MSDSLPIPEHQNPSSLTEKNSSYDPTPEESKAIKMVDNLYNKAKSARRQYDERWLDYYRMFRGKQWKEARPSYRHSEVINLVFRAIQSEVPILTDGMPKPEFVPSEPQDHEIASILNDVLDSDWHYNNWSYQLTEMVYDANFYGTGFGYLGYDHEKDNGLGGICFESADPFYSFPDPNAMNINTKSKYFIYSEPKDVQEMKQEYPEHKHLIKSDLIDLAVRTLNDSSKYKPQTENTTYVDSNSHDSSKDQVLKVCAYVKDLEEVEDEVEGPDNQSVFVSKLKYPKGRKLTLVSGILVDDGPMEHEDAKFPYLRLTNYILPREFWGMSEIEQLESPQKIFNKLISFTLDVLTLMGNPVWIVDNTSGIDTDNIVNRPGLVIEKEPGSEVRREEGVQLQPYVLQMIDRMKGWFDDVHGMQEASRGVRPEGVTAASAIEALQDASQTRLRLKGRNIDAFMQEFGQMYSSRVFQYYRSPRIFRITNNENVNKYFKFHVDDVEDPITGQSKRVAKVRDYNQGDDGNFYQSEEKQYDLSRRFDVRISTGSSMPFQKSKDESQAMQLFDRGIVDAEEVLKRLKYPNAEMILKRMADKAALAAQAEMHAAPPQSKGL